MITSSRYLLTYVLLLSFFLSSAAALADEPRQRRFFFGGDLGSAHMALQRGDTSYSGTWLYGALRAEYAQSHQLLLGLEGAGWTDQINSNDPISEDVLTFMMTARLYPMLNSGIFVKAGWGYAAHRYWESSASGDASGTGYLIGLGYRLYISDLLMSFSSGDLDQETYRAFTLSLGFTF